MAAVLPVAEPDMPSIVCENAATWTFGCATAERIFGVYGNDRVVRIADLAKPTFVLNGTGIASVCVELPCAASFEVRDTFGTPVRRGKADSGLNRLPVPPGGYVVVDCRAETVK